MSQRLRQYETRASARKSKPTDNESSDGAEDRPLTKAQKAAKTREANREVARRKEEEIMAQTRGTCDIVVSSL